MWITISCKKKIGNLKIQLNSEKNMQNNASDAKKNFEKACL